LYPAGALVKRYTYSRGYHIVLSGDSVSYNGSGGRVPEPLFHDTPFDESEWRALYDILRQVNQPKAELMRVQYEAVRTAYQHYAAARAEERDAYAVQRVADEAYNREVAAQRQAVEAQMREARERWRPALIPIARAEFTIAPLLKVPPASRGEPRGARGFGSPCLQGEP
jgi:hypothetical protein